MLTRKGVFVAFKPKNFDKIPTPPRTRTATSSPSGST
jgi:hypothetical protein